jgi:hypothetical protein
MDWSVLLVPVVFGAFGGLLNAMLSGGERYQIWFPRRVGPGMQLGIAGSVCIGIGASLVAWGGALHETRPQAVVVGCLLAGVAGANYLTSQAKIQNLKSAQENQTDALKAMTEAAKARARSGTADNSGEDSTHAVS